MEHYSTIDRNRQLRTTHTYSLAPASQKRESSSSVRLKTSSGGHKLGPVWHGSNSEWSCSTPELQVEPALDRVGAV